MKKQQVYLTRRNLEALLSKLDRKKQGEETACTIIKRDTKHTQFPQTMGELWITAVEDEDYYTDRGPGEILAQDVKR